MLTDVFLLAIGLGALVFGGDILVRGAQTLSVRLGMPPAVIGIVVLGFGTSLPELLTSLTAALGGQEGIALGNVVGSNIANILLILGVTSLVYPVACERQVVRRDGAVVMVATISIIIAILAGAVPRWAGFLWLVALAAYLGTIMRTAASEDAEAGEEVTSMNRAGLYVVGGLIALLFGARWLVSGASGIATDFGVSEALIGLTVVAIGTSLPELSASVAAALKREGAMAYGNVIGSNIFNIAAILGITAMVKPMQVPAGIGVPEIAVLLGSVILAIWFGATGSRIVRWEGGVLLAGYGAYLLWTAGVF